MFIKVYMNASVSSADDTGGNDSSDSNEISTKEQLWNSMPQEMTEIIRYFNLNLEFLQHIFGCLFQYKEQLSMQNVFEVQ